MKILNVKLIDVTTVVKDVPADIVHEITIEDYGIITYYYRLQKCANGQSGYGYKDLNKKLSDEDVSTLEICYQSWLRDQLIFPDYESFDDRIRLDVNDYLKKETNNENT